MPAAKAADYPLPVGRIYEYPCDERYISNLLLYLEYGMSRAWEKLAGIKISSRAKTLKSEKPALRFSGAGFP